MSFHLHSGYRTNFKYLLWWNRISWTIRSVVTVGTNARVQISSSLYDRTPVISETVGFIRMFRQIKSHHPLVVHLDLQIFNRSSIILLGGTKMGRSAGVRVCFWPLISILTLHYLVWGTEHNICQHNMVTKTEQMTAGRWHCHGNTTYGQKD